jgi:TonB family protein
MKGFLFLLLALPGLVLAQGKELRLDVAGEIGIDPQGAVYDYDIGTILTPELKALVGKNVRQWKFEPVVRDGKAVHAKSGMRMILAAVPVDGGYRMRIENVRFVGNRRPQAMVPPRYPVDMVKAGIGATVLVAVRVGANGDVLDAAPAQSRLIGARGSKKAVESGLRSFEKSAVAAAKRWKYRPADIAAGDSPETTLIVPVEYRLEDMYADQGGWREGPSAAKPIPWLPAENQKYDARGLKQGESLSLDAPFRFKQDVVGTAL